MIEFIFSDYYLAKYGEKCAIRGIFAKGLYTADEAEAYRQKQLAENKDQGRQTQTTTDFVIKCQ